MVRIRVLAAETGLSEVFAVEVSDMNCNSSSQLQISHSLRPGWQKVSPGRESALQRNFFVSVSGIIKNVQWLED
jgi:hypothetical protein